MFRTVPQLTVRDLAVAAEFYTSRLGFTATQLDPPENPVFAALDREEASLFLVSESSREEVNQQELAANCRGVGVRLYFEVDDARAAYDSLRAAGVRILRDIAFNEAENYTEFSLLDPDGYEIGIYS